MSEVIRAGGVVVFPADTVYGLACDPARADAVARMYALKGRPPDKPSALMYFELDEALTTVAAPSREVLARLLPGPVTVVLPDGRGLRVPDLPHLRGVPPVLQTSANHTGARDARRLDDVPAEIREGADLVIDGGELPGTPSTVVDLREGPHALRILREGAVPASEIHRRLAVS
jgi:L-threonylcarbamoyladenylate synthase